MSAGPAPATAGRIEPRHRGFRDGHPWYVCSQWAVAGVLRTMADIHVKHMDLCPPSGSGPVILASNHLSYFDIPLLGSWAPRPVIWFSKAEVRRYPVVGAISAAYGSIYVRRGESDRQAIRDALASLAAGQMVCVFPEGTRSRGTGLGRALPGVALLAQRSGATVWPVAVTGTEHVFKQRRPRVTYHGGQPFDPLAAAREAHGPAPTHQQVADTIMQRIAALLPDHYRGVYR